jgi:uncharacterized Ntn-hydrolase superfamily protein
VPWARPGVGAVATQGTGEPSYGSGCLDALARGVTSAEALAETRALDPFPGSSQVGVVGADGSVASVTGEHCIDYAGELIGDAFAVQANTMSTRAVWPAMAAAFSSSAGSLARRLLAALTSAEAAGGDARGRMSAALLVVEGVPPDRPGGGIVVDLRIDRSDDPVGELGDLLTAAEAFERFFAAFGRLLEDEPVAALSIIDQALGILPSESNFRFIRAGALIASGAIEAGSAELHALIAERSSWGVVIRSFLRHGMLAVPHGASIDELLPSGS